MEVNGVQKMIVLAQGVVATIGEFNQSSRMLHFLEMELQAINSNLLSKRLPTVKLSSGMVLLGHLRMIILLMEIVLQRMKSKLSVEVMILFIYQMEGS